MIANPGIDSNVPLYILGSSLYSAHLAAALGLPYAFASHFAPDQLFEAIHIYRSRFEPSDQLDQPYVMAGVMGVVAETDEEAAYYFTSAQQQFVNLRRGRPGKYPPPVADMDEHWTPMERTMVEHTLQFAVVGAKDTVETKLKRFIKDTEATRSSCRSRFRCREAAGSGEGGVGDGRVRQGMRPRSRRSHISLATAGLFLFNRTRPRFPESSTSRRNVGHSICDGALQSAT